MARYRRRPVGSSYLSLGRLACGICDCGLMGSAFYVTLIGLIGTVITALDIARIINCKEVSLRCRSRGAVSPEVERDLKLMTSILSIEHYTLVMLGAITDYPMLHAPWLLMQFCIIAIELLIFLVRLFLEGLHITRDEIILSVLTLHNWLQVFCLYQKQSSQY